MAYLKLFRFPLVFTALADSLAGALLALGGRPPHPLLLLGLAAASGGLYCFGMAMNDVADRERDRQIAPGRVLPSGRVSLANALLACLGVLAVSLAGVVAIPGPLLPPLAAWGAVLVLILGYDFAVKVPPMMGLIRAGNILLGVVAVSGLPGLDAAEGVLRVGLPAFVYGTALTWVSTLEEGRVNRAVLWGGGLVMAAGALGPAAIRHGAWPGWAAGAALGAWILFRTLKAADRKGVMLIVRDGVAGFIVLDAAWLFAAGLNPAGLMVAGLLLPAATAVYAFKKVA
jgi:4-hydroxybenzoate polyprenyltransferase